MIIKVQKKHILRGIQEESNACPVALALIDAGFKCPDVGYNDMRDDIINVSFHYPRSVKRFVKTFDKKGKKAVKPFSFILKQIV